jgi:hypothetical protein
VNRVKTWLRYGSLTVLILFFGWSIFASSNGCTFDTSTPGLKISIDSRFEGCWAGTGGITLRLRENVNPPNLLDGTLFFGPGMDLVFYALVGEVKAEGLAELIGTNVSTPNQQDVITALIIGDSDIDTMALQINDGPPSDPLSRCPGATDQ